MKWRAKITFGMLIISVLFSTAVLGRKLWIQEKEQVKFEALRDRISAEKEKCISEVLVLKQRNNETDGFASEKRAALPEYREIMKENPDFAGWVAIEGTRIDYPVMLTLKEPEYYLHRNFAGEYSYAGVPFSVTNQIGGEGQDIFLYGHNMRNGTMFADLLNFREQNYWEKHRVIALDTLWEHREYEIFTAFYITEDAWNPGGLFYDDGVRKQSRDAFLRELSGKGLYQTGILPAYDNKLLFMVTCSYRENRERFVVAGILALSEKAECSA